MTTVAQNPQGNTEGCFLSNVTEISDTQTCILQWWLEYKVDFILYLKYEPKD